MTNTVTDRTYSSSGVLEDTSDRSATTVSVSLGWAAVAAASVAALAVWVPSGLMLLGFIAIIVTVHEAGHFFVARRSGMAPTEFFWGFGPEVIAIQHKGCRYGIKAISLGGYVKILGMTPTSVLPEGVDESGTYRNASHGGRLATILAGPFVNIAMAAGAFAIAGVLEGMSVWASLRFGVSMTWQVIAITAESLWVWVSNIGGYLGSVVGSTDDAPVRFMSPISQAEVTAQAVGHSWAAGMRWFAILSCAIGVINLVPLPPLDGSHALVAMWEKIMQLARRDRSIRCNVARLEPLAYVTVGVLVALSLSALVMDIRDLGGL